jgi:hypothetical protein
LKLGDKFAKQGKGVGGIGAEKDGADGSQRRDQAPQSIKVLLGKKGI